MPERPLLSIIVVVFNMRREAPRTLHSLTRAYQRHADAINYEVIVVDNGSTTPLSEETVRGFGRQFHYYYLPTKWVSPSRAVNFAAARARGRYITVCVDGARILSPGILHYTALATRLAESPLITTFGWHLGKKVQNEAIDDRYDQDIEDGLLRSVDWKSDGYRLFDMSCPAVSSKEGWFLPFSESTCVTVSRPMFDALGGFDERFRSPGGGLVNLDYLKRASDLPDSTPIVLLGEGTFHQYHGGVATNVSWANHPRNEYAEEYEQIRGQPYEIPRNEPLFVGTMPRTALPFLNHSAAEALGARRIRFSIRTRLLRRYRRLLQPAEAWVRRLLSIR